MKKSLALVAHNDNRLCQFCGAKLPRAHADWIELKQPGKPTQRFVACCPTCWTPPAPEHSKNITLHEMR